MQACIEQFIQNSDTNQQTKDNCKKWNLSALKLLPNFLSANECRFFKNLLTESQDTTERLSNRFRLMIDSQALATWFWDRFHRFNIFERVTDEHGDTWKAFGINPRFRLVKYEKEDSFEIHEDGFFWPTWNERTFATAMVYLNSTISKNSEKVWGSTRFIDLHTVVEPSEGLLVNFLVDNLDHCGEVCHDEKFLLRTDVFYRLETKDQNGDEWMKKRKQIFEEFQVLLNSD